MKEANLLVNETKIEPFIELPLQALKTKRNLLICCILCCAVFFGGEIQSLPSALGTQVTGLPLSKLPIGLFFITLYFEISFWWLGRQTYQKWKLRLTGRNVVQNASDEVSKDEKTSQTDHTISHDTIIKRIDLIFKWLEQHGASLGNHRVGIEKHLSSLPSFVKSFWQYQDDLKWNWILEYWFPLVFGAVGMLMLIIDYFYPISWPWISIC